MSTNAVAQSADPTPEQFLEEVLAAARRWKNRVTAEEDERQEESDGWLLGLYNEATKFPRAKRAAYIAARLGGSALDVERAFDNGVAIEMAVLDLSRRETLDVDEPSLPLTALAFGVPEQSLALAMAASSVLLELPDGAPLGDIIHRASATYRVSADAVLEVIGEQAGYRFPPTTVAPVASIEL